MLAAGHVGRHVAVPDVQLLDRPALFESRPTYRSLDARMTEQGGNLRFSLATYFEMIGVSQALAHEFAATQQRTDQKVSLDQLPFRSLIDDPFNLRRRLKPVPVLPA
jgi:hypothetical protein